MRLIEPKKNERGKQLYFGDTFFYRGKVELPILVGSNNAICMVDLGDLPVLVQCLGW